MKVYENELIENAERQCSALYKARMVFAGLALGFGAAFAIDWNIKYIYISVIMVIAGINCEIGEAVIRYKAYNHVNKRLRKLNKSMRRAVKDMDKDNLAKEIKQFETEYAFLYIKPKAGRIRKVMGFTKEYEHLYEEE